MKVTLISPYPDITAFGLRTLSAHLKHQGHQTQLVFLPDPFGDHLKYGIPRYQENILDQLVSLCCNSDLIGLTLMTNFFDGAVQITKKLKNELSMPVVWGGVHPTIRPEESIQFADMVCLGEGEDALLELVDSMAAGRDFTTVQNFWFKIGGRLITNTFRPLLQNLDALPKPDYSMADHHVLIDDTLAPLNHELMRALLSKGTVSSYVGKTGYQTMTSRGCPYSCAYCINQTIKQLYGARSILRWRSVSHVIDELEWVKENMPYVDYIWLSDDEFMARNRKDLESFCHEYKTRIGYPFSCLLSPLSVSEEKMGMLVEAGLIYVQMGVESGSARMQKLYNRHQMNNRKMLQAMETINKYRDRMLPPSYDFLMDAPYERECDRIESLKFIAEIPKPFRLQPFSLILYPGTQLYEAAKRDRLICDDHKEIYNKTYIMHRPDYLNLLLMLAKGGKFPSALLKLLVNEPFLSALNSNALRPLFRLIYKGLKSVNELLKRAANRP